MILEIQAKRSFKHRDWFALSKEEKRALVNPHRLRLRYLGMRRDVHRDLRYPLLGRRMHVHVHGCWWW